MSEVVSLATLRSLVDQWIAAGRLVAGPKQVNGRLLYGPLDAAEQLVIGDVRPQNSIKEYLFPRHEKLYSYQISRKQVELTDAALPDREQIIVAARPCDAAAAPILDHIFNWDFVDAAYNRRRELTTIVTLACQRHDSRCFCTSVGSGSDDPRGSDAMLLDLGEGILEVRCYTEKARRLFAGQTQSSDRLGSAPPGPAPRFSRAIVQQFIGQAFDDPHWPEMSRRCLGCGACAYTCPTCHCFDIVDEATGSRGVRVRNWDACQLEMFTAHASGHNPRSQQAQRQRQRLYHKFHIYPQKFGELLCTGCGNCTRNCPAGLGILPVLAAISRQVPAAEPQGAP
jgi:ferredoxin